MREAPGVLPQRVIGRYALYGEIASGGMATVHFGRLLGPVGFSRTVAIKRLHPQFAKDPEFVSMFLDEARVAARIQHPNVVATLDVVALAGELFLVMEYVQGESLARVMRRLRARHERVPPRIAGSIGTNLLYGLHAAHEANSERGEPLNIVHRDVSPQNVLVGTDGVSRVLDFGVAKAAGRIQVTRDGQVKGKLAYMAPEQLAGHPIDRRADVYAASVVIWEALTGRRLFDGDNQSVVLAQVLTAQVEPPSKHAEGLASAVDDVIMRGLSRNPEQRFATAHAMAIALEDTLGLESPRKVGEFLEIHASESLSAKAARVKEIESLDTDTAIQMMQRTGEATIPGDLPVFERPVPGDSVLQLPPAAGGEGSGLSKVSSVSVSLPARPAGSRRAVVVAVGATAGLLLGAALWIGTRPSPVDLGAASPVPPVTATPSDALGVVAVAASATGGEPTGAPPDAAAAPAIAPAGASSSSTSAASPPSAVAPPDTTPPRPPPPRSSSPKQGSPKQGSPKQGSPKQGWPKQGASSAKGSPGSCDPPYTVDPTGKRKLKTWCL
jgi:serine/threonine-protein kinase